MFTFLYPVAFAIVALVSSASGLSENRTIDLPEGVEVNWEVSKTMPAWQ